MLRINLLLSIFVLGITANAQQNNILKRCIKDSITVEPISYGSITNLSSHKTSLSHKNGCFEIEVQVNNIIAISAIGYYIDTIRVTASMLQTNAGIWFIKPLGKNLPEVFISTKTNLTKYQRDSAERRKEFLKDLGNKPLPTFSPSNSGAGIGFNLDHFYGKEKRKRNAVRVFDELENEEFINYHFNAQTVSKYAALEPDDMLAFLKKYRPTFKWLRNHNTEEDLLYYINEKLKYFKK
jgi:hypothetical protein